MLIDASVRPFAACYDKRFAVPIIDSASSPRRVVFLSVRLEVRLTGSKNDCLLWSLALGTWQPRAQ